MKGGDFFYFDDLKIIQEKINMFYITESDKIKIQYKS